MPNIEMKNNKVLETVEHDPLVYLKALEDELADRQAGAATNNQLIAELQEKITLIKNSIEP